MYALGNSETITITKGGVTSTIVVDTSPITPTQSGSDTRIIQITPVGTRGSKPTAPFSSSVGFHTQANPVQRYISALQQALNVRVSGVWDAATHEALRAFVRPVEIGTWGQDPSKVARNATVLISPSADAEFERNKRFLGLLGFPVTSRNAFDTAVRPSYTAILTVLDDVADAIRMAEATPMSGSRSGPSPATESFFSKNKVLLGVGAGVLVLSTITLILVLRRNS